jgi:hypothetical protein
MFILYAYKLFLKFSSEYIHPNYLFYCFECCHRVCPNLSSAPCTAIPAGTNRIFCFVFLNICLCYTGYLVSMTLREISAQGKAPRWLSESYTLCHNDCLERVLEMIKLYFCTVRTCTLYNVYICVNRTMNPQKCIAYCWCFFRNAYLNSCCTFVHARPWIQSTYYSHALCLHLSRLRGDVYSAVCIFHKWNAKNNANQFKMHRLSVVICNAYKEFLCGFMLISSKS